MKRPIDQKIADYFKGKNEVVAVYLFGSYARGKEKPLMQKGMVAKIMKGAPRG